MCYHEYRMGDIIYIGYDVINIAGVMSYIYGCDVIHVCDVIQRVGVV